MLGGDAGCALVDDWQICSWIRLTELPFLSIQRHIALYVKIISLYAEVIIVLRDIFIHLQGWPAAYRFSELSYCTLINPAISASAVFTAEMIIWVQLVRPPYRPSTWPIKNTGIYDYS